MSNNTETIRDQNDHFRQGGTEVQGRIVVTQGIQSLLVEAELELPDIMQAVQQFDSFTEENDPHGEHDFAQFDFHDASCYWKFDYYDPTLSFGSNDPSDLTQTMRVLTIMLAVEY